MRQPTAQILADARLPAGDHRQFFEVELTNGPAFRRSRRVFGDIDNDYPWHTLDPAMFASQELVERARLGWTENALNEYLTAGALAQLVQQMVKAQVPIDLVAMASSFIEEEVLHVELCARVAHQLGGGAPLAYAVEDLVQPSRPELTPRQALDEHVISLLCIGETLSLPLLTGCMRAAGHPLVQRVLKTIVKDEADHGRLGWLYLDWVNDQLGDDDRRRLSEVAMRTLDEHAPVWTNLRSRLRDRVTSEGHSLIDIHAMGWMDSETYVNVARNAVEQLVIKRLATYGILLSPS